MKCPECGRSGAYIGLNLIECINAECRHYKPPRTKEKLARVFWRLKSGLSGNSRLLSIDAATKRAVEGNNKFGENTHWVEVEEDEGDDISWLFGGSYLP